MERMREIRARIAPHDSAARFRDLGVDVFLGEGRFVAADALEVGGQTLRFARAVLATGARATAPPIPGLAETGYLTNESVFSLEAKPARLAVIGGGPIGCELAQTFARLGVAVTVFEVAPKLLEREDADAAAIVQRALERDGVRIVLGAKLLGVARDGAAKAVRWSAGDAGEAVAPFDEILVAAGRAPNVEGIGLETAGVRFEKGGITVDDRLRTTNPRIYAVGDCCMAWKFTHAADAAAKLVVQNAFFFGRKQLSSLVMPWCTYTDPELAHVGLSPREAEQRGIAIDTYTVAMDDVDRAVCDGEDEGFVRLHTKRGTDQLVGATIVASHAGDMLSILTAAITNGLGLGKLAGTIFPYPTQAEAIKAASNQYMRTRLTPAVKRLFETWLRWRR
jgi:pyruvate/2-oxoglutarate dehydrogenase complex dihydrolipoamide dehydrogenase (E3) component